MDLMVKFAVIWLSMGIVIIATGWYAASVIKPRFPNWWKQVIVDDDPFYLASLPSTTATSSTHSDTLVAVQVEAGRIHQLDQKF